MLKPSKSRSVIIPPRAIPEKTKQIATYHIDSNTKLLVLDYNVCAEVFQSQKHLFIKEALILHNKYS